MQIKHLDKPNLHPLCPRRPLCTPGTRLHRAGRLCCAPSPVRKDGKEKENSKYFVVVVVVVHHKTGSKETF